MHPPLVGACLFGLVGVYTILATDQTAPGMGMLLVCATSVAYHSTYSRTTRQLDIASNVGLCAYFSLFDWRWYFALFVPWLGLGWKLSLSHRQPNRADDPWTHVWFVHLPALLGFPLSLQH